MSDPGLSSRLLIGALAGMAATAVMTAAMRQLHMRLPEKQRYPLPPRELTERISTDTSDEDALRDRSLAAHFAYGGGAGALIAAMGTRPRDSRGALLGVGVWAVSYAGWIPALGVLRPASEHPVRRNALMIGVHLLWGTATAWTIRELAAARDTILVDGPLRDAPATEAKGEAR